jgi:FG-GAP-like repeat
MGGWRREIVALAAVSSLLTTQPATGKEPDGAALARSACSTCHALAPPDVLPRAYWKNELQKMMLILEGKEVATWGNPQPDAPLSPDYEAILRYYETHAPAALPEPEQWPAPDSKLRFERRSLSPADAPNDPAVSNVRFAHLDDDSRTDLIVCDMRYGLVLRGNPADPNARLERIAQVPHPAHAEVTDLDGDGVKDLIVADLGEFYPGDHTHGAVVWLRGLPGGRYANYSLGGFPRVADVEAADFDGDGRKDLVVAAFGWRHEGEIDLLHNGGSDPRNPEFDRQKIDGRPGSIHVIPADMNHDGLMDFVALTSQQYETVVAFINEGPGKGFKAETIYAAPHPNWGSSGIQLVDLDGDGDLDVLMTNGDMFDDKLLKPYHGIQWLENKGGYPFEAHLLAHMPGAQRAVAVDLDGDGDLDIVASAFTAGSVGEAEKTLPSLVWLEQTKKGRFERHTLELGNLAHASLDVADFDHDGDMDIAVGNFIVGGSATGFVDIWENLEVRK